MHVSIIRDSRALLIGAGIQVRPSSLGENSGMGAFLTADVECDTVVTIYDGWLVLRALIPRVGEVRNVSQWSHCMAIKSTDFAVIGLRDPVVGRGAGSFINHCRRLQNVVAVNLSGNFQWDYYGDAAVSGNKGTHLPVLAMAATRDIKAGEELFTCYPPGVCKWMGIDYDIDPATREGHHRVQSSSSALPGTVGQVHNRPAESEFDLMSSMELDEFLASQNPTDKLPLDSTNSEAISETAESP